MKTGLLDDSRALPGFLDCHVLQTGMHELMIATLYASEAAAETAQLVARHRAPARRET